MSLAIKEPERTSAIGKKLGQTSCGPSSDVRAAMSVHARRDFLRLELPRPFYRVGVPIRGRYNSTFVNEVRSASNQCTCVLIRIETCDWLTRFEKPRDLHTAFYRVRPDPLANHTPFNARGSGVSRLYRTVPPPPPPYAT